MSVSRRLLVMPLIISLVCTLAAEAADTTLSASAWAVDPIQPGSEIRDPLQRRGLEVYLARCQVCHGAIPHATVPGGLPPMPGTQALQAKYQGEKPAVLEERTDLTPEFVSLIVRGGIGSMLEERTDLTPEFVSLIVRGGIGSMPFFRPTEITGEDLAALGAYLARKIKRVSVD